MRRDAYFPVGGGVNVVTPSLKLQPGELLTAQNYEPDRLGNYRRIDGYERYDGQPKPSGANYWYVAFDAGTTEPSVGDKIMGETSEAEGILIAVIVNSGSWATNDAAGELVIYELAGTFVNDEPISNLGPYATAAAYDAGFSNGFS